MKTSDMISLSASGIAVAALCWILVRRLRAPRVPRARSMSIPSAFLVHGPFPKASGVPFNVILGVNFMEELPSRQELIELAREKLVAPFVRFRTVPEICSDGLTVRLVDPKDFNVENHVTVRDCVDEKDILAYANERMVQSLPRDRPLWELVLLRNRANPKRSAVLGLYDHATADGISSIAIFNSLFTDAKGVSPNMSTSFVRKADPGARGRRNPLFSALGFIWSSVRAFFKVAILASPFAPSDSLTMISGPATRIEKKWSKRSVVWTTPLKLDDLRSVRKNLDITVNDALTAVLTGCLRRYMQHRNDPALKSKRLRVRALLPVAMPRPKDEEKPLRNYFAMLSTSLPVQENDIQKRISFIHSNMARLKNSPEAFFTMAVQSLGFLIMPLFLLQNMARDLFTSHSVLFSNVPGPSQPVFICGKPVHEILPAVATIQNQVTALSYNGNISVGFMIDDEFMKDAHLLPRFFEEEYKVICKLK